MPNVKIQNKWKETELLVGRKGEVTELYWLTHSSLVNPEISYKSTELRQGCGSLQGPGSGHQH